MKQNNRQRPDSKLLSLFSTWQQRHQTASVQLTAAAPAVMEHLRLASRQCLAGTSGDTGPVWAGTGALCPRHTWQCVTKAWHVPVSSGAQSGVWAPDSLWLTRLCREYQDSVTHAHMHWNPSSIVQNYFARRQSKGKQRFSKLYLKLSAYLHLILYFVSQRGWRENVK